MSFSGQKQGALIFHLYVYGAETRAAAVGSFEANDLRRVVLEAATACRNRSVEMGTEFDQG